MDKKIKLYTDGGCRGNQNKKNIGAWAIYMVYGDHKKSLSGGEKNTTNNKMEMTAVIMGLSELKRKDLPVEVYVDSQYVLDGITKWIKSWERKNWKTANGASVKNIELWVEMDRLVKSFSSVTFIKVKGHSNGKDINSIGNNLVDKLCNEWMDTYSDIVN